MVVPATPDDGLGLVFEMAENRSIDTIINSIREIWRSKTEAAKERRQEIDKYKEFIHTLEKELKKSMTEVENYETQARERLVRTYGADRVLQRWAGDLAPPGSRQVFQKLRVSTSLLPQASSLPRSDEDLQPQTSSPSQCPSESEATVHVRSAEQHPVGSMSSSPPSLLANHTSQHKRTFADSQGEGSGRPLLRKKTRLSTDKYLSGGVSKEANVRIMLHFPCTYNRKTNRHSCYPWRFER